mmetsp:Transcript_29357/g.67279  ORF Transcript_29357/g.67279 Transcript_29357/m.67279 type:complete len:308 (+) Transcript_29357:112-1035(+)
MNKTPKGDLVLENDIREQKHQEHERKKQAGMKTTGGERDENTAYFKQAGRADMMEQFAQMRHKHEDEDYVGTHMPIREYQMLKKKLLAEKDEAEHALRMRHTQLLELGDPDEEPVTRTEFCDGAWVLENYKDVPEEGMEIAVKIGQDLSMLCCEGSQQHLSKFRIRGTPRKLLIGNCCKIEIAVDACIVEIVMEECKGVTLIIGGEPPSIKLKDCVGIGILLTHTLMDGDIQMERCAGVVLSSSLEKDMCLTSVEDIRNQKVLLSAETPPFLVTTIHNRMWTSTPAIVPVLDYQALEHKTAGRKGHT